MYTPAPGWSSVPCPALDPEALGLIGGPARPGDFDHPGVVERGPGHVIDFLMGFAAPALHGFAAEGAHTEAQRQSCE